MSEVKNIPWPRKRDAESYPKGVEDNEHYHIAVGWNECCDYIEETKKQIETKTKHLELGLEVIRDMCVDYDGYDTVIGLKGLVDDIKEMADKSLKGK